MRKDRVKVASLRSDLADIINRVRFHNSRVVVVRHGEPVAAMVSMEDLAELERYRSVYTTVGAERPAA